MTAVSNDLEWLTNLDDLFPLSVHGQDLQQMNLAAPPLNLNPQILQLPEDPGIGSNEVLLSAALSMS